MNFKKILLSAALTVGVTATSLALASEADAASFSGGKGTFKNPYQISTVSDLKLINKHLSAHYILTRDINLGGMSFESIGSVTATQMKNGNLKQSFSGTFNGNGHTISNATVKSQKQEAAIGFFEVNSGKIFNVTFKNIKTKGGETKMCTGDVVGCNFGGTISKVTLSGKNNATGINCVGGIAGGLWDGQISNCKVTGLNVAVVGNNDFATGEIIQHDVAECGGLIIGGGFTGTVKNCSGSGTVTATGNEAVGLGGVAGCLQCMDSIIGNSAAVTIKAKNAHAVGGLCGYAGTGNDGTDTVKAPCEIKNCNVIINIDAAGATHVGGLVGTGLYYYGMEDRFNISDCTVKGSIDGAITPGTVAGRATGCKIISCKTEVTIDGKAGSEQIGTTSQLYQSADQFEDGSDLAAFYLIQNLSGYEFTPLFDELLKPEYDELWLSHARKYTGEDNARATADMLKAFISGKSYGESAIKENETKEIKPFYCGFIENVAKLSINGNTISGIDKYGKTLFSHTYRYVEYNKELGWYAFKTDDAAAGEFTWFYLAPDTPDTTFHIEFRYGSSLDELSARTTGKYAYWQAAGLPVNADKAVIANAIQLFCVENLIQ